MLQKFRLTASCHRQWNFLRRLRSLEDPITRRTNINIEKITSSFTTSKYWRRLAASLSIIKTKIYGELKVQNLRALIIGVPQFQNITLRPSRNLNSGPKVPHLNFASLHSFYRVEILEITKNIEKRVTNKFLHAEVLESR